jgi:Antitoxin VbhA
MLKSGEVMNANALLKSSPRITPEEMERRRNALAWADAHNRIEGIMPDPATEQIFDAYVHGEIELHEMQPLIKAALQNC